MPGWETYIIEISKTRPFKQAQDANRALSRLWETNIHFLGPNIRYWKVFPVLDREITLYTCETFKNFWIFSNIFLFCKTFKSWNPFIFKNVSVTQVTIVFQILSVTQVTLRSNVQEEEEQEEEQQFFKSY